MSIANQLKPGGVHFVRAAILLVIPTDSALDEEKVQLVSSFVCPFNQSI
jgi:hypothetical protein